MFSSLHLLVLISMIGNYISAFSSCNLIFAFVWFWVKAHWNLINVFFGFFFEGCVELITVSTPEKYINVTVGGSALLQCSFATTAQTTNLIIQWDFVSSSSMTPQQVNRDAAAQIRNLQQMRHFWCVKMSLKMLNRGGRILYIVSGLVISFIGKKWERSECI